MAVPSGSLPPGTYTVQILWENAVSPVTTFTLSGELGAPLLRAAGVDLTTVTLAWDPGFGSVQNYEMEATLLSTGQAFLVPLGGATAVTFRDVMPGRYSVRIRARNAIGPGPFSNAVTVVVGFVLALGDLQITLTWNTTSDMDLHIIEPDGTHVSHENMEGTSARLDFDDVDGFGPENVFVAAGRSLPGVYHIGIAHGGYNIETTSTIAITLGAGTEGARTVIFTRRTRESAPERIVLVAAVNVRTGEVVEWVGTR